MKAKFEQSPENYERIQSGSNERQIGTMHGAFCASIMPIESPKNNSAFSTSSPDARQTQQPYLPKSTTIYAAGPDPKSHHPVEYDSNRAEVKERVFQNQINQQQSKLLQALNTNEEGCGGRFSDQSQQLIKALGLDMKLPGCDMIRAIRDDVITPAKSLSDLKNELLAHDYSEIDEQLKSRQAMKA